MKNSMDLLETQKEQRPSALKQSILILAETRSIPLGKLIFVLLDLKVSSLLQVPLVILVLRALVQIRPSDVYSMLLQTHRHMEKSRLGVRLSAAEGVD